MTKQNHTNSPVELDEGQLEQAQGGIGMLLPAVQKIREAAARTPSAPTVTTTPNIAAGDGSV